MNMTSGIKSKKTYWLFALLCAMLWGSGAVCIKLAYGAFGIAAADSASQLLMSGVRFMLAGVLTEVIFFAARRELLYPPTRAAWGHAALLSVTEVILLYSLYSTGTARSSGTMASAINGTSLFFTILFATCVFRTERMDMKKALACVLGFGAVLLMNLRFGGRKAVFTLTGEGALLLSQCMAGLSHNITKRFSRTDDPAMLTAYKLFFGGAVLAVWGLLTGGRLSGSVKGWLLLSYLSFVSGAAFSLWGLLMKYHGVSRINVFMLANPLFGVLFSALLLGETELAFSPRTLLALLMIAAGILLVNLGHERGKNRPGNTMPR